MDEPQIPSPRPTEPPPSDPPTSSPPYVPPAPPVYQQPPVYTPPAPPAKKSKLPWILGGCGCLTLFALLLGAGGYALYQYRLERARKELQSALSIPTPSPSGTARSSPGLRSSPAPSPSSTPSSPSSPSTGDYGKRLEFDKAGEVYYTSKVTEAEAKRLGNFLVDQEFFDGTRKSVQLNKSGNTYEFRMVVKQNIADDESKIPTFKAFARELSTKVFGGSPVVLHLCDNQLKTLRVVAPDATTDASEPSDSVTAMKSADKTYTSSRDKLPSALAERFVAFSFNYPPTFVVQPQDEETYVTLQKMGSDGKTPTETFMVGWYEPPDSETQREVNKVLSDQTKKWSDFLPDYRCKEVRKFSETVGGMPGRAGLVQFVTRDGKNTFVAAGKTIVVRPTGQKNGVAISLYGTWEDPAIKSASDLGERDDLAKIVRSFKFL